MNETTLIIILASSIGGGFLVIACVALAILIVIHRRKKRSRPARTSVKSTSSLPLDLSPSHDEDVFHPSALPPPFEAPRWTSSSYDKPEPTYATAGMYSFATPGKPNFHVSSVAKATPPAGKDNSGFVSDDSGYTTLNSTVRSADSSFYASHNVTNSANIYSQAKSPSQKRIHVVDAPSTEPYAIIDILNLNGKMFPPGAPQREPPGKPPAANAAHGNGRGYRMSSELKPQPAQEHIYFELEKQDEASEDSGSDAADGGDVSYGAGVRNCSETFFSASSNVVNINNLKETIV